MSRPRDQIIVETDAGQFDAFESVEITNDLQSFTECSIKVGNVGSWPSISALLAPGRNVRVRLNGRIQFTGRFERDEVPNTASNGSVAQVMARTKLSDAKYASADPKLKFDGVSIKQFLIQLFAPLGYTKANFLFAPRADVNLVTGKKRFVPDPVDLEPIKADQQKVNPPETIWETATRVLKRHHLTIWCGGGGSIIVGKPDDDQSPLYRFLCKRGPQSIGNNVLEAKRSIDWSDVASEINVYGGGKKHDVTHVALEGIAVDREVFAVGASQGHFQRRVIIPDQAAKTKDQAQGRAKRELATRAKNKDGWEIKTDGWSQWDGHVLIPFCVNATADVDVDSIGSSGAGRYLVIKTTRTLDKDAGATSTINLAVPGSFADL